MIVPLLYSLRPRWLLVALAALTMSCANAHDPAPADREHGLLVLPQLSSVSLYAPQAAKVGVPFEVTVRTFGSSNCNLPVGMDITQSSGEVLLVPWVTPRVGVCTDDLRGYTHVGTVTITQPGVVRLVAFGYKQDLNGNRALGTIWTSVNVSP